MAEQTELLKLCTDVAFFLNVGEKQAIWTFDVPSDPEKRSYPSQYITNVTDRDCELTIRIETYGHNKGRVEVSGNFHISRNEYGNKQFEDVREYGLGGHSALPGISVAGTRGPEAIAREIKRRFLPEYLPLLRKAQAKRDSRDVYYAKVRANLLELGAIVNADPSRLKPQSNDWHTYSSDRAYVDIHAGDTEIDLKISNLTMDQAKRVLAIVNEPSKLSETA